MSVPPGNPYGSPATPSTGDQFSRTQRKTLTRIDFLSTGKLMGALYAIVGLIFGGIFFLMSVLGVAAANAGATGIIGGVLMLFFFPVAYGVGGFIGGIMLAALYNLVATLVGGIEFDLE